MNKIETLIQTLCPNGVIFKPLWSVTAWDKKFKGVDRSKQKKVINYKKYFLGEEQKALASENGTVKILTTYESSLYAEEKDVAKYVSDGEVVCIPWGGNAIVQYYKGKFITGDNRIATSINVNELDNKFLWYVLKNMIPEISSFYRGSGIKHPEMNKVLHLEIPIPPLKIQHEIVRILDSFSYLKAELITALSNELISRKSQYEHYKKILFKSDHLRKIGDVCVVKAGGTPSKAKSEYWENGTIKWLGSTVCQNKKTVDEVTGYITELGVNKSSAKIMQTKSTLIAMVGATIGKTAFLPFEAAVNQNVACLFPLNESELNPDYLFYACSNLYPKFQNLGGGKLSIASLSFIKGLEIYVPSLDEQKHIANLLEKYDIHYNDITSAISKEIEAREEQFEYYRNKLLTFRRLER